MPTGKSEKEAGETVKETFADAQPKIVWDDTKMRSVYANVSNVAGGREEIVLLFGMNQNWQGGQAEVKVELTERVVLSPHAAKRLTLLLAKVINNYESRFGKLDIGPQQPAASAM